MDPELHHRLTELETKIDKVWHSVEQTRKMYLWTVIISIVLFMVPLIGLVITLPKYLETLDLNSLLQ